jgi:hypothetical protein
MRSGEGGGRRVGVGQITAHSNPYSSFSSSSFPLCVRRGFDEKFCFQQCRTPTVKSPNFVTFFAQNNFYLRKTLG